MKLLEFIVILGICLKGHYASASKLSSDTRSNRRLLIKGSGADTKDAFVYFAVRCSATRISASRIATDTASCGSGIDFCAEPKEGKCEGPTKVVLGTDNFGVTVYNVSGEGSPETSDRITGDCIATGFGKDDTTLGERTSGKVSVFEDGIFMDLSMTGEHSLCPGDNGGGVICGGKLVGIIMGTNKCGRTGKALKVTALMTEGNDTAAGNDTATGGAAGNESTVTAAPAEPGDTPSQGSTSAPPSGSGQYAVTPSMIMTALPMLIVAYLDH